MDSVTNYSKITSTPKAYRDASFEETSSILKTILGVSPVAAGQASSVLHATSPSLKWRPDDREVGLEWKPEDHDSRRKRILEDQESCLKWRPEDRDSGFGSMTAETSRTIPDSQTTSLFRSICHASNLSLEQVVERVQVRRRAEQRSSSYIDRRRSLSDSEVSGLNPSLSDRWLEDYSPDDKCSPGLDQAILMGCRVRGRRSDSESVFVDGSYSSSSPDYDLAELVRALHLKSGPLLPPSTPSPPGHSFIKSPLTLFGAEFLSAASGPGPPSRRLPLPSISESGPLHYSLPPRPTTSFPMSPVYPEGSLLYPPFSPSESLDDQAALLNHSLTSQQDSACTWSGKLPPGRHKNPVFSCKIFVGGVPWDVTELSLIQAFKQFGNIRIEWPGKDTSPSPPKGYVYIIFEQEHNVPLLLGQCTHDFANGGSWYYKISSRRMRSKEVQIIPWVLADSNYVRSPSQRLDSHKTVFVGALHGMLNAEGLAQIFSDLFGSVVYAGIDTDKHKYPIGSGRVTFNNSRSYMKAVAAAFIEVKCQKFTKKVQVDPYLEDALCSLCLLKQGPYFCRDLACFKYFCRYCWEGHHSQELVGHHKPLMRNNRTGGGPATRPTIFLSPNSELERNK